jgi:hypothetical protein
LSICRHRGRRERSWGQQGNLPVVSHRCLSKIHLKHTNDSGGWIVDDKDTLKDVGVADAGVEVTAVVEVAE